MFDVIIVGAGVIGSSIARNLSKYKLSILVLEKENDVGDGASGANSAIIHSGYDPKPGTLKAEMNVKGNPLLYKACSELDVEALRIGSITLANNDEEIEVLKDLAKRSEENGVEYQLLDHDELLKIEPNITKQVKMGLLAPTAGIINPFELVVALMENAIDNGVELKLNQEVIDIKKNDDSFTVFTKDNNYQAKYIINASGVYSDKVSEMVNPKFFTVNPRRGEYFVLDHFDNNFIKHTLFNVPTSKGKGVLVSPTTHFNYLVGPSSDFINDKDSVATVKEILDEVKFNAKRLVDNVPYQYQIRVFSGVRAVSDNNDFIIEETSKRFINVAGIQSPGLASSQAIALKVEDIFIDSYQELFGEVGKNENFNPRRRPLIRLNKKTIEERRELIKKDPKLGRIICRCEQISEGEVLDVLNRSCPPHTIKGVKKRCRPGFGKCQGGFCEPLVMKILQDYYGLDKTEIDYGKKGTYITLCKTKNE
ncbi:MAG: FAD-dependent oxidoreductase [Bacilli bacterium]|nr:FAD-dependent oxidoreductase [Bacilli bacterium]